MVTLTADYIERKCSQMQLNKSLSNRINKDKLYDLTHLRMNDMSVSSIGNFAIYRNLKVIYLQDNNISTIENLQFASNLTHLYLQHNLICRIENLEALQKLQTLYLGYNNIAVVEGLECLRELTVFHVENQRLISGESLCFDPRSIHTLSNSLKVLNISGNKITSLKDIKHLYKLEVLDARDNFIDDVDDLTEYACVLISLRELSLQGNPITTQYRYRENLIANNNTIKILDGKIVTDICRRFMKKFKMEKHLRRVRKSSKTRLDEDITSSLNLPPALKQSISRAIFQYPDPKFSSTLSFAFVDAQPQMFPAWKTAPSASVLRHGHVTPRPFWSNVIKKGQVNVVRSSSNHRAIKLPQI